MRVHWLKSGSGSGSELVAFRLGEVDQDRNAHNDCSAERKGLLDESDLGEFNVSDSEREAKGGKRTTVSSRTEDERKREHSPLRPPRDPVGYNPRIPDGSLSELVLKESSEIPRGELSGNLRDEDRASLRVDFVEESVGPSRGSSVVAGRLSATSTGRGAIVVPA